MLLPRSCLLLVVLVPGLSVGEHEATRLMYDTMAQLVGDPAYPDTWYNVLTSAQCPHSTRRWAERQECFSRISPGLLDTMDLAWQVVSGDWSAVAVLVRIYCPIIVYFCHTIIARILYIIVSPI